MVSVSCSRYLIGRDGLDGQGQVPVASSGLCSGFQGSRWLLLEDVCGDWLPASDRGDFSAEGVAAFDCGSASPAEAGRDLTIQDDGPR